MQSGRKFRVVCGAALLLGLALSGCGSSGGERIPQRNDDVMTHRSVVVATDVLEALPKEDGVNVPCLRLCKQPGFLQDIDGHIWPIADFKELLLKDLSAGREAKVYFIIDSPEDTSVMDL